MVRAFDIHVDNRRKLGVVNQPEWRIAVNEGGVVDDEIDTAKFVERCFSPATHLGIVGHIHLFEMVWSAIPLAQGGQTGHATGATPHGVPTLDEGLGHGESQATADTSDDDSL